jgi:hypothetical protein
VPHYTITATAGSGGFIEPAGTIDVAHGGSVQFTMTAEAGFRVADVSIDGNSVGSVNSHLFTDVTENHTIEVIFSRNSAPWLPLLLNDK